MVKTAQRNDSYPKSHLPYLHSCYQYHCTVQSLNHEPQASLSITNSWSSPKRMSIEPVMPSNHLILCCPLLLMPSVFPSIRVFPKELALCIRQSKYQNFIFNLSSSNEYSGLISYRIDWFNLLVVQGTLQSLLRHYTSKASIL